MSLGAEASAWSSFLSSVLSFLDGEAPWMSLSARALFPLLGLGLGTETAAAADAGLATAPVCCAVLDLVVLADAGFEVVASEVAFFLGGMVGIWSKERRGYREAALQIYKRGEAIQRGQSRRAGAG